MKPGGCFYWLLIAVFLFAGRPVHASSSPSTHFRQAQAAKTKFFGDAAQPEFKLPAPGETTADTEPILGIEDDNEEQVNIGKQAPVVRSQPLVFALFALPPPVSTASIRIAAPNAPLLCPCRYLAHRALII